MARSAADLNLSVLKRLDGDIEEVIASAGHVALYDYDTDAGSWRRKDIEGSLFILRRSTSPRFQMLILNKKSTKNYAEDVLGGFEFENAPPYLLYRNERDEVVGVWFYDQGECERVEKILQKLVAENKDDGKRGGGDGGGGAPSSSSAAAAAPSSAAAAAAARSQGDFWDQPASLPEGYDPLGGAGRAGQQQQQQQQPASPSPRGGDGGGGEAPPSSSSSSSSASQLARLLSNARLAPPQHSPAPVPPPAVLPPNAGGGSSLQALLSRGSAGGAGAGGAGGATNAAAPPHSPAPMPPPPPPPHPSDVAPAARDAVRRALLALAGDDAFLNAITRALRSGGVPI